MDVRSAVSRIDYYTQGLLEAAKYSDSGREITWVIVESDDDCEVYGGFLADDNSVKLRDSGCKEKDLRGNVSIRRGWERVERLVAEYSESLTIIGIRDRDYTKYEEGYVVSPNVYETDCRDIEMMMIQAGVLERIIPEEVRGRRLKDILASVYEHVRVVGYMRIMNAVRGLTCQFHDFHKMSLFWDQTSHSYRTDWYTNLVSSFFAHCSRSVTEKQFNDFVKNMHLSEEQVYDVCRGHDVVDHLAWNLVSIEYSRKKLPELMKNGYSFNDFQTSMLYSKLKDWEKQTGRILLKTA